MKLSEVIAQLKNHAPYFGGNVAGIADYELARDQVWLTQPAAYVVPLEDEPSPQMDRTGLYQTVRQTIGIIVDLDNAADRRGQDASSDAVDDVRTAIFAAVLNWIPSSVVTDRGFAYARGGFLYADRARLRWQFDFSIEQALSSSDGWQPSAEPLTDIRGTETDLLTGRPYGTFDAALPQT